VPLSQYLFQVCPGGSVHESEGILFGRKQENLIRETSDKGNGPAILTGNQIYLVAYIGAAYRSILALGSSSTDPTFHTFTTWTQPATPRSNAASTHCGRWCHNSILARQAGG